MSRELLHSSTANSRFSTLDGAPDALPTVAVYAGTTLLGSATVTADGTDSYRVSYTLPSSGIADYTEIWGKVEYDVDTVAVAPQWLLFGVLVPSRVKDANLVQIDNDVSFVSQLNSALEEGVLNADAGTIGDAFAARTRINLATELARIDATISSRADTGTVNDLAQTIPSASVIAAAVSQEIVIPPLFING